jgi:hypothetical protein
MRNALTLILLLLAAVLAALSGVLAATAHGAVLDGTSDEYGRFSAELSQMQAEQRVPLPAFVRVKEAPCPNGQVVRGCYDGYTIWLMNDTSDRTFRHELGHAADAWALAPYARILYQATVPEAPPGWLPGAGEWFAESYEDCSLDPATQRPGEHAYGYAISDDQYAAVCGFLGTLARPRPATTSQPVSAPQDAPQRHQRVCKRVRRHHRHVLKCHRAKIVDVSGAVR